MSLESLFPSDRMSRRSLRRFVLAPNALFLVAENETGLLGNLLLLMRRDSRTARLYSVIIDPAARGQGLAKRLVTAAEGAALDRGMTAISLEVRAENRSARALYESLNYATAAALPGYYDDGGDGLRLRKTLTNAG